MLSLRRYNLEFWIIRLRKVIRGQNKNFRGL